MRFPILFILVATVLSGCVSPAPSGPPNVLLVSLDTVRADHLSVYGYPRSTTPNLERLARRGTVFNRAFSPANESAWSHGALFTGRYASEVARPDYETYAIPEEATLLPEILRLYGYRTGAFIAGGHVGEGFGFRQGWDSFQDFVGYASFFETLPPARTFLKEAPSGKPWFLFVHSYDAHRPYIKAGPWNHLFTGGPGSPLAEEVVLNPTVSEQLAGEWFFADAIPNRFVHPAGDAIVALSTYRNLAERWKARDGIQVLPEEVAHIKGHYDGCLAYMDYQLGRFLGWMDAGGFLKNTVVLIVSDHGEDLLDHGFMNHRTALTDSCTRVPLLAFGPGFPGGSRQDALVDLLDVVPTILQAASARTPAGLPGRPLQKVASGLIGSPTAVYSEGVMDMISVRTETFRLVFEGPPLYTEGYTRVLSEAPLSPSRFSLYDLRSDPSEHQDLLESSSPEALAQGEALRKLLVDWRLSLKTGQHGISPESVDPEVARQLRVHGYWESREGDPSPESPRKEAP